MLCLTDWRTVSAALAIVLMASLAGAAEPNLEGGKPLGKMIVIGVVAANCKCENDVQPAFGAGNAGCITAGLTINPLSPAAECDIDEVCTNPEPCKGSFTVQIAVNNWAPCCPGALNNMEICINGAGSLLIPHGFGGSQSQLAGGTKLACQDSSDSSDTDAKKDTITVVCGGTGCTGGNPGALKWTGEYTEYCFHCPAGDDA